MVAEGMDGLKIRTLGPKSGAAVVAAVAGATATAIRASARPSLMVILFGFTESIVFVRPLEDEECLFFDALVGDESLAVEVVLQAGVDAAGGAEVHQDPRASAAELRDLVEHCDLVVVDLGLIFLSPEGRHGAAFGSVVAGFGIASPLG